MSLSFQDVLGNFCIQAQVALDEETGLPTPNRQEQHRFTQWLNEAATWVWRGQFQQWTFPELITGATVTLATGGIVTAADIDNATFWSVWQSDPRLAQEGERQRLALKATAKANGDLIVDGQADGAEVFVIWRTTIPKWSAVLAAGFSQAVSVGTRLWNKQDGDCGDGHVYRALVADATPDDFDSATQWAAVTLPEVLLEPVVAKAMQLKMRGDGLPGVAQMWEGTALNWMESRAIEAERAPHEKPWLYNQNA